MSVVPLITRRLTFAAGHRVHGHEGKCANPHGHNYVVEVSASAADLDPVGRVIDFSEIKKRAGTWLDTNWDHGFIYAAFDADLVNLFAAHPEWKSYAMTSNPTAENIAAYLVNDILPPMFEGTGIEIDSVRVWETENCSATAI